jgi:hypothetical protein
MPRFDAERQRSFRIEIGDLCSFLHYGDNDRGARGIPAASA